MKKPPRFCPECYGQNYQHHGNCPEAPDEPDEADEISALKSETPEGATSGESETEQKQKSENQN